MRVPLGFNGFTFHFRLQFPLCPLRDLYSEMLPIAHTVAEAVNWLRIIEMRNPHTTKEQELLFNQDNKVGVLSKPVEAFATVQPYQQRLHKYAFFYLLLSGKLEKPMCIFLG